METINNLLAETLSTHDPTPLLGAPFPVFEVRDGMVQETPFSAYISRLRATGVNIRCITLQRAILDHRNIWVVQAFPPP